METGETGIFIMSRRIKFVFQREEECCLNKAGSKHGTKTDNQKSHLLCIVRLCHVKINGSIVSDSCGLHYHLEQFQFVIRVSWPKC